MKEKISEAQRKQKKGYDDRNNIDKSTPFKVGDRVWLNDTAVPKGLSRKFHLQWSGPYTVLNRLGSTNYHIKPESGNRKPKVVHRNRLKSAPCRPRVEEGISTCSPKETQRYVAFINVVAVIVSLFLLPLRLTNLFFHKALHVLQGLL